VNSQIFSAIRKNLSALPGWRTSRRLIVIESDDWGGLRMPSSEARSDIMKAGIDLLSDAGALFNKYDTLASPADLSGLFEALDSVRDATGRPAVITPVAVVANPDFEKIRANDFDRYFYEPFTVTLGRFKGCEDSFGLWQEGIRTRLFMPQFHGREHLNVPVWMRALKNGNSIARTGFDNKFWGMTTRNDPTVGVEFQAAFDFIDPDDISEHRTVISDGLDIFKRLFGYNASYFAPPNGPLSSSLEPLLSERGIKYLSMPRIQEEPIGYGRTVKRLHWMGKKGRSGLTITTRNCFFEPVVPGKNWTDLCLADISTAFRWSKPAIISSHRVNYIGGLSEANRKNGLDRLGDLLKRIIKRWPEAEFITSAELGDIICDEKSS